MTTDDNGFLSRWSQRKHEAKLPDSQSRADESAPAVSESDEPVAASEAEEKFDLSSLPNLEDVVEGTDITGFLKKGVPESMRNAALRKSWALDPAIRNYVNPALEYAYDWNTPGGVPGSGELAAGLDVAKMVLQIMGDDESVRAIAKADTPDPSHPTSPVVSTSIGREEVAAQNSNADLPVEAVRASASVEASSETTAASEQAAGSDVENVEQIKTVEVGASQQAVRRHGTAKPTL